MANCDVHERESEEIVMSSITHLWPRSHLLLSSFRMKIEPFRTKTRPPVSIEYFVTSRYGIESTRSSNWPGSISFSSFFFLFIPCRCAYTFFLLPDLVPRTLPTHDEDDRWGPTRAIHETGSTRRNLAVIVYWWRVECLWSFALLNW